MLGSSGEKLNKVVDIREGKIIGMRKRVEKLMDEFLPVSDKFTDFGIRVTREEIIDNLATKLSEDVNRGEAFDYIYELQAQMDIGRKISNEVKDKIISELKRIVGTVRREVNREQGCDNTDCGI